MQSTYHCSSSLDSLHYSLNPCYDFQWILNKWEQFYSKFSQMVNLIPSGPLKLENGRVQVKTNVDKLQLLELEYKIHQVWRVQAVVYLLISICSVVVCVTLLALLAWVAEVILSAGGISAIYTFKIYHKYRKIFIVLKELLKADIVWWRVWHEIINYIMGWFPKNKINFKIRYHVLGISKSKSKSCATEEVGSYYSPAI